MTEFLETQLAQLIMFTATVLSGFVAIIQLIGWGLDLAERHERNRVVSNAIEYLYRVIYSLTGLGSIISALFIPGLILGLPIYFLLDICLGYSELSAYLSWVPYYILCLKYMVRILPGEIKKASLEKIGATNRRLLRSTRPEAQTWENVGLRITTA